MVCRICLNKTEFEINIFDENTTEQRIAMIIQKHFWFTPLPDDSISNLICLECWKKILEFHDFYETVEQAHKIFYEKQQELASFEGALKNETSNEIESATMHENSPTPEENTKQYEVVEALDSICGTNDNDNIVQVLLASENESYKSDEEADSDEITLEKLRRTSRKCTARSSTSTGANSAKTNTSNSNSKPKQEKRSWTNPEAENIVRKHLNLNCDICSFPTESFRQLEKHFQTVHRTTKAYIKCCGRRIGKSQRVVQHAYTHEDPNYFQCNICKKGFATAYSLRSHKTAYHPTEEELKYHCDYENCGKRFPRQYLLDYHKAYHVPEEERKFQCIKCQKNFGSDHLLKAHISTQHRRTTNVCHICAKTIRDKPAFEKHVRLHFEESGPRLKCTHPGCDKYLKDQENLKVHMRRHKQENQDFPCKECGKILKTRTALVSHKNYVHSKETFNCSECSKSFKRELTLKEHMAQHTGEPLYKCPFCPRTFNSNANMHSHKKKTHPVEWENWRRTKTQSAQSIIVQKTLLENFQ